jgi:nitroreductase
MNSKDKDIVTAKAVEVESSIVKETPDQGQPVILDVLRRRWSPKVFSSRPVEPEKLRAVLEAARWAPSSHNEQPWSFVVATQGNPEAYNVLLSCLNEKNRQWAQYAPVLILSVAKIYREMDGKENRYAFHDVGLATANLIVQATALELYTHAMAGFSVQKAQEVLGIPKGYEPVAVIALGYFPESRDWERPRTDPIPLNCSRKPLDEFVFEGRWGNPAPSIDHHGIQETKSAQQETSIN